MNPKNIAVVSYITIIGWIIAFAQNKKLQPKSRLAAFHLRQSLGLFIFGVIFSVAIQIVAAIVPSIAMILSLLSLVILVLWIIGLINAAGEKEKPLPLIGGMSQKMFSSIQ